MAVVQISRIQQRRGKKNSDTGFPQLASGEIAWAIDAQELYIGNGAVSEGAPYVGNTKILTEHDNVLDFATLYQYQRNNPVIKTGDLSSIPVRRSVQDRLDDYVSVRAFGIVGDSTTDVTEMLQRAIDQLFLNDSTKNNPSSRVILFIEPGEYIISGELKIPPFVHLMGAGIDSTIIIQEGDTAIFRMVDANSRPGIYTNFAAMTYLERPRKINISNLTLKNNDRKDVPLVYLDNTDSTVFDHVKFEGAFSNGLSPYDHEAGVYIRSASGVFRTENILFNYCEFSNTGYGVYSASDHDNVSFDNCKFFELFDGINVGGSTASISGNITMPLSSINSTTDVITIASHGLVQNQYVQYQRGTPTSATSTASSISGTTLTLGGTISGTFLSGMILSGPNVLPGTRIVSGSNNTWQVNQSQTASAATISGITTDLGGLVNGAYYFVKLLSASTFSLTLQPGGSAINLTTLGNNTQYLHIDVYAVGSTNTKVTNSYFDLVDRYGYRVRLGYGNSSIGNKYINVGNNFEGYANAEYPNILFDSENNQSIGDYFERNKRLKDQSQHGLSAFIDPVKTSSMFEDQTNFRKLLEETTTTPTEFFRFPASASGTYIIDYVMDKSSPTPAMRSGTLHITTNLSTLLCHVQDDFGYTGSVTAENIKFTANLIDFNGDNAIDTLIVYMYNPVGNGVGSVNYSYRSLPQ